MRKTKDAMDHLETLGPYTHLSIITQKNNLRRKEKNSCFSVTKSNVTTMLYVSPYCKMALSASFTYLYLNSKPSSFALTGKTFCPSRTTVAPSPSKALSAKSGTGSQDGRLRTLPSCWHISPSLTGFGAVPLITPANNQHQ